MLYIGLAVLGLCFGSFVNALVWRLHENSKKTRSKQLSVIHGRSICPHCHHQLGARDLIPVISWLNLRGKCRYCHQSISPQYPLVELLTASTFILSYAFWPSSFSDIQIVLFSLWLIFVTGFMALAIYDLRWYILPDKIIYPLIVLAVSQGLWLTLQTSQLKPLTIAFWGVIIGGGLFYVLYQASNGRWIGGGDVKLGALAGLIISGPGNSLLMIFLASLLGSLVSVPLIITGRAKRSTHLPFGPFLIVATIIVRLFGASLIAWYKRHYLLY